MEMYTNECANHRKNRNAEWAVIPYKEYMHLVAEAEMLQDVRAYDTILKTVEQGEEERIPAKVVYAILDGENPIRVWRELSAANAATISRSSRDQYALSVTIGVGKTCRKNRSIIGNRQCAQCDTGRYCQRGLMYRCETYRLAAVVKGEGQRE